MPMIRPIPPREAEAIRRYIERGGRVEVLRPSLAPVCVPVSQDRPQRLGTIAALVLARLRASDTP